MALVLQILRAEGLHYFDGPSEFCQVGWSLGEFIASVPGYLLGTRSSDFALFSSYCTTSNFKCCVTGSQSSTALCEVLIVSQSLTWSGLTLFPKEWTASAQWDGFTSSPPLSACAWAHTLSGVCLQFCWDLVTFYNFYYYYYYYYWSITFLWSLGIHINLLHQQSFQNEEFFLLIQLYLIIVLRSLGQIQCAELKRTNCKSFTYSCIHLIN